MSSDENLIFVSIAAYRDPQLVPTVLDCIEKSGDPEGLRFGICWQRGPEEEPLPFRDDPRIRVLEVDWRESRGACWARAEVMKLWQGEDWFLQVDSHCRFASDWDAKLLQATMATGSAKPVLSTYGTPFTPRANPAENEILQLDQFQIIFQGFTADGLLQLRPATFPLGRKSNRPVRARFLSAGFLFAEGGFVEEVPYDPELYFLGEESTMTVRAFTHGYDLFHPVEPIVWHDYFRHDAKRHWGDHTEANLVARSWSELDRKSRDKVQRMLLGEAVDSFGLGSERTLEEYEAYAGVSFRQRKAQQYTVRAEEPPNPEAPADWTEKIYSWIVKIRLQRSQLPHDALLDPALWYVGIVDEDGYEVCRRDFTKDDLAPFSQEQDVLVLICEFASASVPAAWTITPLSRSKGWLCKISGQFQDDDFALLQEDDESAPGAG